MAIDTKAYKHALYPFGTPPHLTDEEIARQLDESEKRSRAARKREQRRQQAKQQGQEKQA